jgi:hypothetical protein
VNSYLLQAAAVNPTIQLAKSTARNTADWRAVSLRRRHVSVRVPPIACTTFPQMVRPVGRYRLVTPHNYSHMCGYLGNPCDIH